MGGRHRTVVRGVAAAGALVVLAGCGGRREQTRTVMAPMTLTAASCTPGHPLPAAYTCNGLNTSPALSWSSLPRHGVESFVIVLDDPDAPGGLFTHWVLFNVRPSLTELPGGLSQQFTLPHLGATHGRNDFGRIGYGGPCPPAGQRHRYIFHVYALDTRIALGPGVSRTAVDRAMRGHVVGSGALVTTDAR